MPIRADREVETHAVIESVEPDGLGATIGLQPGDEIVTINGSRMEDVIDYRFLIADAEVTLEIAPGGDPHRMRTATVEKDEDETLGVMFTADVFDGIRICNNNCDFCFVYQNPRKMRRSLYIKDDDYRLSFLHGDFITLTNLTEAHFRRIIDLNLSPLYVSIHATDPAVRVQMLRNPLAARLWEHLGRLFEHGIQIHGQVVLCPGMNNGPILERTIEEMAGHYPNCLSMAIVPVGLTGHRRGLPALDLVDRAQANEIIDQVETWQRRFRRDLGARFVYASDEMYLRAGRPFPPASHYEAEGQYENGVGMVAHFLAEWRRAEQRLIRQGVLNTETRRHGEKLGEEAERLSVSSSVSPCLRVESSSRRVTIVTGTLAAPVLAPIVARLNEMAGLDVGLATVVNKFFGPSVTVAGLLTATDIVAQCQPLRRSDALLVPDCALRGDRFLDDLTIADVARELDTEVVVVPHRAAALVDAVLNRSRQAPARAELSPRSGAGAGRRETSTVQGAPTRRLRDPPRRGEGAGASRAAVRPLR
jgi:putative radical SAM enzyme (TIGR03279 family)